MNFDKAASEARSAAPVDGVHRHGRFAGRTAVDPVARRLGQGFHGRNKEKWYNHDEAWERYDYLYSDDELRAWVEPVRGMAARAGRTLVYMNNHRMGQAPQNADTFRHLLDG